MQKRTYYIPTIEITFLKTAELMFGLGGSGDHADQAPVRFAPAQPGETKAF